MKPSKSKRRSAAQSRNGSKAADEAFDTICRELARLTSKPPAALLEAVQELYRLTMPDEAEGHATEVATADGRAAAGIASSPAERAKGPTEFERGKRGGRHDLKAAPRGWTYDDGWLMRSEARQLQAGATLPPPWPPAAFMAMSILYNVASWLNVKTAAGHPVQLSDVLRWQIYPNDHLHDKEPALAAAWLALTGKRWGYPNWAEALESQLTMNARHTEQQRLRRQHGHPKAELDVSRFISADVERQATPERTGALFGPATAEQIHRVVGKAASEAREALPAELTVEAVQAMIDVVGVGNRGGGGRRGADVVIGDFLERLKGKSRPASPRKQKQKRHKAR